MCCAQPAAQERGNRQRMVTRTRFQQENHAKIFKKRLKIGAHALLEGTEGREFAQGRLGWTTRVPRSAQERPKSAQERPKSGQDRPENAQECPTSAQDRPESTKTTKNTRKHAKPCKTAQKCAKTHKTYTKAQENT